MRRKVYVNPLFSKPTLYARILRVSVYGRKSAVLKTSSNCNFGSNNSGILSALFLVVRCSSFKSSSMLIVPFA